MIWCHKLEFVTFEISVLSILKTPAGYICTANKQNVLKTIPPPSNCSQPLDHFHDFLDSLGLPDPDSCVLALQHRYPDSAST